MHFFYLAFIRAFCVLVVLIIGINYSEAAAWEEGEELMQRNESYRIALYAWLNIDDESIEVNQISKTCMHAYMYVHSFYGNRCRASGSKQASKPVYVCIHDDTKGQVKR